MNKVETGGPAFPCMPPQDTGAGSAVGYPHPEAGMTLRDYQAAQVLPAVYSDYCEHARKVGFDEGWMMGVAIDAYAMADAMLAARNVNKEVDHEQGCGGVRCEQ